MIERGHIMLNELLGKFKDLYSLKKVEDDQYGSFKLSGMKFDTEAYEAEGLGHISVMKASGMMGLMKMDSFIVNPFDADMPLLSIDRIKAMGKDSLYMEIYDTCLKSDRNEGPYEAVKEKYKGLADIAQEAKWYDDIRYKSSILKKVSRKESPKIDECIREYVNAYLEELKKADKCDNAQKKAKAREYSDGLINNGGPAVNTFLKAWGKGKTKDYFDKVLFG